MAKNKKPKATGHSTPKKRATGKLAPSVADQIPTPDAAEEQRARDRYVQGVVNRGEAVPEGTPLPPGATHVITGQDADGKPIIRRKRYSLR